MAKSVASGSAPLAVFGDTHPGRVRTNNEDRFFFDADHGVLLVVDGVGGHRGGEIAAEIAIETIRERLEKRDAPAEELLRQAIGVANDRIFDRATRDPMCRGMSCVLTLALIDGDCVTIGHVGDSRLYTLTRQGIVKLTHDHSPVGEREDRQQISETDAMHDPHRNEVFRDVGSELRSSAAPNFIEVVHASLDDQTALLLCSDGLTDIVTALEINRIVRAESGDPARVVRALIDAANAAGGKDNITVVYAEGASFAQSRSVAQVLPTPAPPELDVETSPLAPVFEPRPFEPPRVQAAHGPRLPEVETARAESRRALASLGGSRTLIFALGVFIGVAAVIGFGVLNPATPSRELTVGAQPPSTFRTIYDALQQARRGDVVKVEPGNYRESLQIPPGVTVEAARIGAVALQPPEGAQKWVAVEVRGGAGGAIRGVRITGLQPGDTGIQIDDAEFNVEDVTFDGTITSGVVVSGPRARATIRASRFSSLPGIPVRVLRGASATLLDNVFVSAGGSTPAIALTEHGTAHADGNVFVSFLQPFEPPLVPPTSYLQNNVAATRLSDRRP